MLIVFVNSLASYIGPPISMVDRPKVRVLHLAIIFPTSPHLRRNDTGLSLHLKELAQQSQHDSIFTNLTTSFQASVNMSIFTASSASVAFTSTEISRNAVCRRALRIRCVVWSAWSILISKGHCVILNGKAERQAQVSNCHSKDCLGLMTYHRVGARQKIEQICL